MKKLSILFTLFIFSVVTLSSCDSEEKSESDTDTTKAATEEVTEEETSTEETSTEEEPAAVVLSEEAKPFAKEWAMTSFTNTEGKSQDGIDNAFLTLGEDGKFKETFSGKEIASGTWDIIKEGDVQVLVLTHLKGEMATQLQEGKEKLSIKEFSTEKMITSDDDGKMTETFMAVGNK